MVCVVRCVSIVLGNLGVLKLILMGGSVVMLFFLSVCV